MTLFCYIPSRAPGKVIMVVFLVKFSFLCFFTDVCHLFGKYRLLLLINVMHECLKCVFFSSTSRAVCYTMINCKKGLEKTLNYLRTSGTGTLGVPPCCSGPCAGSGVVRMDPIRFLARCHTRRLNQICQTVCHILACFLLCCLLGPLLMYY